MWVEEEEEEEEEKGLEEADLLRDVLTAFGAGGSDFVGALEWGGWVGGWVGWVWVVGLGD